MDPDFVLSASQADTLQTGRWAYASDDALFYLTGPGTIDCIQGVLTNDILRAGPEALVWGALLTAKGLIITDLWVKREGASAWLIVPRAAREITQQLLARTFPPRLTKVVDRSNDLHIWWVVAPSTAEVTSVPNAIFPLDTAPFTALVLANNEEANELEQQLRGAGWEIGDATWSTARKVVVEWPTLGREIGEKTLVQEVRFDELHGVKYDKGCYIGQETVARLHFRGHANRELKKIVLPAPPSEPAIRDGDTVIGRITTWGNLGTELVALAMIRKEKAEIRD